jgi:hypothetical protein
MVKMVEVKAVFLRNNMAKDCMMNLLQLKNNIGTCD